MKTGVCAIYSPAELFVYSTARIRQDISTASFCSCNMLWRIDECVLLPYFNKQPDIFQLWTAVSQCWVYFPLINLEH